MLVTERHAFIATAVASEIERAATTLPSPSKAAVCGVPEPAELSGGDLHRPPQRDLRLDFFRGLALLFIFVDHIPFNRMSWFTIHNYGFSDAAEIFVFLSGYAAALAYGRTLRGAGFRAAAARILRRCGELYIAHLVLLVLFTAQIAVIGRRFDTDFFAQEMQVMRLLQHLPEALPQALLLKFRPAFFDVLPLYIVFLLGFPVGLWGLQRRPVATLTAAALLYLTVQWTHINFPAYPPGLTWNFNPLAWQFLFLVGAFAGGQQARPGPLVPRRSVLLGLASGVLAVAGVASLTAYLPALAQAVPNWLTTLPVAKPHLPPLRLLHFFALTYVTVSVLGERPRFLSGWPARLVIGCGQRSLPVFCVSILLSLAAHMVFVLGADTLGMHALVSLAGIAMLLALGVGLRWVRRGGCRHRPGPTPAREQIVAPVEPLAARIAIGYSARRLPDRTLGGVGSPAA